MDPMNWINARAKERTSIDGVTLIVVCLIALFFSPLIKWAAWAGLIYGAWTIWKSE